MEALISTRNEQRNREAWLTVFGWTILGTYTPSSQNGQQSAITHVVSSVSETELSTEQLLRKFWELEEPTVDGKVMTPTELQVEKHYEETHSYIKSQKRYMVRLPKVEVNTTLGESKTAAINWAKGNERSLVRKNKLQDFQSVMQEYLDLGHAQPVTQQMCKPTAESYYMPIHAVFKESSTTTKVRAVFDASSQEHQSQIIERTS